jgi:hypothetical protein
VPLESQNGVFGVHAASVVADTNQPLAAFLNTDGYSGRARINGVLNQLLDNRCGSLNDLPRSNLGSDIWWQNDNATQNFFASVLSFLPVQNFKPQALKPLNVVGAIDRKRLVSPSRVRA